MTARTLMLASIAAAALAQAGSAQEAPPAEQAAAVAAEPASDPGEPLLAPEEIDELVAPVALYPDPLLAQVLVASTYPLEIVKAERWVDKSADLAADARAEAAAAEGWDPSVSTLAAGFPTVVTRMAEDLDWTESLGDAVLVQTDDVMDGVQRQRARAAAVGNLDSNPAQSVVVEGDTISIAPANPEVVYVPAYNPQTVYTQPAPAAPVVVTDDDDDDYDSGDLLLTGVIAFGAGMLVNEVFDDDDDWDGYWGGSNGFDWDDGDFYPRPGRGDVEINGDVNINTDRDRVRIDNARGEAWRPDEKRRTEARDKLAARDPQKRPGGATTRPGQRPAANPGGGQRDAAREKLSARGAGGGAALKPAGERARPAAGPTRDKAAKGGAFAGREEGLSGARKAQARGAASAGAKPKAKAKPAAGGARPAAKPAGKAKAKPAAFDRKPERSGDRAGAAKSRGAKSGGGKGGKARR